MILHIILQIETLAVDRGLFGEVVVPVVAIKSCNLLLLKFLAIILPCKLVFIVRWDVGFGGEVRDGP